MRVVIGDTLGDRFDPGARQLHARGSTRRPGVKREKGTMWCVQDEAGVR
jgi:hypothetical protein